MIVILDNIRSIENVGSIFRTADALGVERIVLTGITPSPLDVFGNVRKDFAKVSLGSETHLEWQEKQSLGKLIGALQKEGYTVLAVEQAKHSVPYYSVSGGKGKIALILGSETKGLSPAILKKVGGVLEIPMRGIKESLNVAVSFGIVGFHLLYGKKK